MQEITLEYKKVNIDISYYHQPRESAEIDYPGCEEDIEIESIKVAGVDVSDLLEMFYGEIECLIIKELNK